MFWVYLGLFGGLWKSILTCGTKTNKAVKIEGHSLNVVGTLCQFCQKMLIWYYQVHFSPFWAYKEPIWIRFQFLEIDKIYRMTFKFCVEIKTHFTSLFSAQLNPWVVLEMCQCWKYFHVFYRFTQPRQHRAFWTFSSVQIPWLLQFLWIPKLKLPTPK